MTSLVILGIIFLLASLLFSSIGLGGGIFYVPIMLFAGYSMNQAPGISLFLILCSSVAAMIHFWKNKKVDWKLALVIDPPTDIMAFVGGYCSPFVPEAVLEGLLAGILLLAGYLMVTQTTQKYTAKTILDLPWYYWRRQFNGVRYAVNVPLVLLATAGIGILSGILGITGGIIKMPIMVLFCGVPMDIAIATSTVMVAVTALSGVIGHALHGQVEWHTALVLSVMAILGGTLGSHISLKSNKAVLQKFFGIVLWIIAIIIIFK